MKTFICTEQGHRSYQEDRLFTDNHSVWAVADGMGGHPHGDKAAQACIDALESLATDPLPGQLHSAFWIADKECKSHRDTRGSTFTCAQLRTSDNTIIVFHAGDSFAFQVTPSRTFKRVSKSHELPNGALTNGVGFLSIVDQYEIQAKETGWLILATDGLEVLTPDDWVIAIDQEDPAKWAVARGLERGSRDNLTCIVVQF